MSHILYTTQMLPKVRFYTRTFFNMSDAKSFRGENSGKGYWTPDLREKKARKWIVVHKTRQKLSIENSS